MFNPGDLVRVTQRFGEHPDDIRVTLDHQRFYENALNELYDRQAVVEVTDASADEYSNSGLQQKTGHKIVFVNSKHIIGFNIGLRDYDLELVFSS